MKPYDKDKPAYQWTGYPPPGNMWFGGRCYRVKIPDLTLTQDQIRKQIENQIYERDMQRGSNLVTYGIYVAIVCAVVHGATKANSVAKVFSRFAEWGIIGGVLMVAAGLLQKKVTQYQDWITLGVVVIGGGVVLYILRDKSISHIPWLAKLWKPKDKHIGHPNNAPNREPEPEKWTHGLPPASAMKVVNDIPMPPIKPSELERPTCQIVPECGDNIEYRDPTSAIDNISQNTNQANSR